MGLRTTAFLAISLAIALPGAAQIVGDPAGPRPGPVHVLELAVEDHTVLQRLTDEGYNIGHFAPGRAEIYATPDEHQQLLSEGYPLTLTEVQPGPPEPEVAQRGLGVYHKHADLTSELQAYEAAFPSIARLVNVGDSVQGRELWALLITDNPNVEEDEPEFKYVGSMHGDEIVGAEMCLYMIDTLLDGYGVDNSITFLVNTTAIWILPLMNPDGRQIPMRNNANGFDLNRSFPEYPEDYTGTRWNASPNYAGLQSEVIALMQWAVDNSFVLSANFHGGEVVVSYPYDAVQGVPSGQYATAPDDLLFVDDSLVYAETNPCLTVIPGTPCTLGFSPFPDGVTNGNEWYEVKGGMQDWMYRFAGNAEITIELSASKTPSASSIAQYWADNEESMLAYIELIHRGIRGVVTDAATGAPLFARVTVAGNTQPAYSDEDVGDYYRMLVAGTYNLTVEVDGYEDRTIQNVSVTGAGATRVDVIMHTTFTAAALDVRNDFESLDANDDHLLTLAESGLSGADFDAIDTNNDNFISMVELLEATLGAANVGNMDPVYVDAAHTGDELGTLAEPFTTIREGVGFVTTGGVVRIMPGTYTESLYLAESAMLMAEGAGTLSIGATP